MGVRHGRARRARSAKLSKLKPSEALLLGYTGFVLVLFGAQSFTRATPFPGTAALVPVAGTVFMIMAGLVSTGGISRLLSSKPLVAVGNISYGWYLWHWPCIVFATPLWSHSTTVSLIAAVFALGPTYLSYHYVEQPVRLNATLRGRPRYRSQPCASACRCCSASPSVRRPARSRGPTP